MANFGSSLRSRLVILILMAVIPAFGLNLYSASKHRELTAVQVKQNALVAARVIAAEQDRILENAHQFLVTLANVPQIRENDKTTCHKILSSLLEPRYADLVVADRIGNPLCTALPPSSSVANSKGTHHTRSVETYDFSVGKLRYHPDTFRVFLDVSYPVQDRPGIVRAVISAALDFSWISKVVVNQHLYPGVTFTLVNSDGIVLFRYPDGKGWIGKSLSPEITGRGVISRSSEKTIELKTTDGVRRLFAFSRLKNVLGNQSVYAAIDLPATLAFAKSREILLQNLAALGILSAILLCSAWFGTDVFVLRRIRDIIGATNKVTAGDLKARTTLGYQNNELGQMAWSFDNLAHALETRQAEAEESARQIHSQRQQQDVLFHLIRGITSTLDVGSVLSTLLDHLSSLFPTCAVTVSWINKKTNNLEPIGHRAFNGAEQKELDPPPSQILPNLVLTQQCPIAISNARLDPRARDLDFFLVHRLKSYLGLPLIAKQETLGVLSFYSREEREFSTEEITFLNGLVNEAAIAIHNSRLFEQTREQAIELEKSNKIKDEFLGVMSHELRTPLNIIMNYAEALQMGTFGAISSDQEGGTEKIRAQARQLLALINGILEITKIESSTVILQSDAIDMLEFMAECRSDYLLPLEKDLALEWNYPVELPIIVSDRMKLKQILTNLINNAIKFTDNGSVTISAHILADREIVELRVTDTGVGIPEEMLPFIFDKFQQIDSAMTRNYSGAGLGLFIVKNFVNLLGGTLEARSKVGEGSVFSIYLPIQAGYTECKGIESDPMPASDRSL